jgi:hypothetical protein
VPQTLYFLWVMAGTTGLEPATSAVTGQRSDQLSYVPKIVFQQLGYMSHRIKRFAVFAVFARFYHFVAADSILGVFWTPNGHQTGHQNEPPQQQIQVYQNEVRFGVHTPSNGTVFDAHFPSAQNDSAHLVSMNGSQCEDQRTGPRANSRIRF